MFVGNERQGLVHGLSDQHSIERVAVGARQSARDLPVADADRQSTKALVRDRRVEVRDENGDAGQLSNTMLGRDFPGRGGADKNVVCCVGHGFARSDGERGVAAEPPEKGMGVEQ